MKLILENWKKFLEEEKDLPLGKYVWPKDLYDPDPEKEKEINTALEDELRNAIKNHLDFYAGPIKTNPAKELKKIIDDGAYPDIFKKLTEGEVYRGMYISLDDAKKLFNNLDEWPYRGEMDIDISLGPQKMEHPASSWSRNYDRAEWFSRQRMKGEVGAISIIFFANTSNSENYFMDLDPLYKKYEFAGSYRNEEEAVGIGDIKVHKVWYRKYLNWDQLSSEDQADALSRAAAKAKE